MSEPSSKTAFTELNDLSSCEDGVFRKEIVANFDYSDGEESEQRLQKILCQTSDLSSESKQLNAQIMDWPTEYHLSSTRANLLRALDLTSVENVLELGCGCGAISRYLGEQPGLRVDSVEGSSIRASLAALRCQELSNVTISNGNFNAMEFPQGHYDLVLFVGVTEYAGRFSDKETDQEALQDLFRIARATLKPGGVALVAIENRLGLKYLMGASEDHYGVPHIGVDDYPQSTGIRTYSRDQWGEQIAAAGFSASSFSYPFPDYKIPTTVIADGYQEDAGPSVKALSRVRSRDYLLNFDLGDTESRLWGALHDANSLGQFSNSFLILMGEDQHKVDSMQAQGCVEFSPVIYDYVDKQNADEAASQDGVHNPAQQTHINNLSHELVILRNHAQQLEQSLTQMKNSRIWKFLERVRQVFTRP